MRLKCKHLTQAAFAACLFTSQIVLATAGGDNLDGQDDINQLASTLSRKLSFKDVSEKNNEDLVHLSQQSVFVEELCRQALVETYEDCVTRTSAIFKHLLDAKIPNAVRNATASKNSDEIAIETLLLILNTVVTPVFNESVLPALLENGPIKATSNTYSCSEYNGSRWNGKDYEARQLYEFNPLENTYSYPLTKKDASNWVKDIWKGNDSNKRGNCLTIDQYFDFWADHLDSHYKDSIHLLTGRKFEKWSEYAKECAKRNANGKM